MRALIRIAILLLLAHGLYRFVPPYFHHHQFESALKDLSTRWGTPNDEEVMQHVLTTAAEHQVPITRDHVSVQRQQNHILIDIDYTVPVEFIPSVRRDVGFKTHVDAWRLETRNTPGGR